MNKKTITTEDIIKIVENVTGVKIAEIRKKVRKTRLTRAKQLLCYLLRKHLDLSHQKIATVINKSDHTGSINSINAALQLIDKDDEFTANVLKSEKEIEQRFEPIEREIKRPVIELTKGAYRPKKIDPIKPTHKVINEPKFVRPKAEYSNKRSVYDLL